MRTTVIALAFAIATALCGNVHAAPAKKHAARAAQPKKAKLSKRTRKHADAPKMPSPSKRS